MSILIPTGSGVASAGVNRYRNPFHGATDIIPERIDAGVDYGNSNRDKVPLYAIGPGKIVAFTNPHSDIGPGMLGVRDSEAPAYIAYTLTRGPAKGWTIYYSECMGINYKLGLRIGLLVNNTTRLANMRGCGSGIEIGWADGPRIPNDLAEDYGGWLSCDNGGNNPSGYGINFSSLLQALRAPGGRAQGPQCGSVDSAYRPPGAPNPLPSSWSNKNI